MARGELETQDDQEQRDDACNEAAAAFGLAIEAPAPSEDDVFYLYPENVETLNLWPAISTQWRVAMDGATGLDYAGVRVAMDYLGIKKKRQADHFLGFQAMERAMLEEWAIKREKALKKHGV